MAKKEASTCTVCAGGLCKFCSLVALTAGVLFLLRDLNVWNFWNISWYTVAFLMVGSCFLTGFRK